MNELLIYLAILLGVVLGVLGVIAVVGLLLFKCPQLRKPSHGHHPNGKCLLVSENALQHQLKKTETFLTLEWGNLGFEYFPQISNC